MQINMSFITIYIVDAWLAYKIATGTEETQADFYLALAEEMRDDTYDQQNLGCTHNSGYKSPY